MAAVEQDVAAAPPQAAPPVVAAAPQAPAGAPLGSETVLAMQRTAGNRAVCRAIATGMIQRAPQADPASIGGITVSPLKATMPLESGTTIQATGTPATAAGVTYSLAAGTAAVGAGTTIDASTGAVTLDAAQAGGSLKAKATAADGTWADQPFRVIEKPTAIASTSPKAAGVYEAHFTHTFSSAGAGAAGLDGANINEKFASLSAKTPFDGDFTLTANADGSLGWDLDGSGTMVKPDKVSIGKTGVNANKFVKNASNPAPAATLPQGFTMTQSLHAKSLPSGNLDAAAFTTTDHVRRLEEKDGKLVMTLGAGGITESIPYAGPAVYRNARADKPKVEASGPKPKTGTWKRNEVQVSVDVEPAGTAKFSITGAALGCSVDRNGKVLIGDAPGTITVRAGDGAKNYDEVSIQITAPPAAVAPGATAPKTAEFDTPEDEGQEPTAAV